MGGVKLYNGRYVNKFLKENGVILRENIFKLVFM